MARTGFAVAGVVCLATLSAVAAPAHGLRNAQDGAAPATAGISAPDFRGTVALSNCSGAVVRFPTSQPTQRALVLTNGHCHDYLDRRQVLVDRRYTRRVLLLARDGSVAAAIRTDRLVYATMYRTDVALYRLRRTYVELRDRYGVRALTLADHGPRRGTALTIPSGYWATTYHCQAAGIVHTVREADWRWRSSLRFAKTRSCQMVGGTSGSPVMNPSTRRVLAVNNTANEDGQRCTLDNPCEVDAQGRITVDEGRRYGQQTWWLTTCVRDGLLDLSIRGCKMPKPLH